MRELHLQGWISKDSDGIIALATKKDNPSCKNESFPESIRRFAESIRRFAEVTWDYDDSWLGGRKAVIPNANMRMYVTDKECSFNDAMTALVSKLCGAVETDIGYEGYSEWTITGYYLKEFAIGGHDLNRELETYIGKYIHLVLQC